MVVVQSFRDAMLVANQREAYEFTRIHVFSPGTRSVPFRTPYFATTRRQRRHCTRMIYEATRQGTHSIPARGLSPLAGPHSGATFRGCTTRTIGAMSQNRETAEFACGEFC